jgi:UDP-N-acetyl-D-galactosamine dehydrogenase
MHNRIVAVVGLGYVGLPVAVAFGKLKQCIGFDVNSTRIDELKNHVDKTGEVLTEDLKSSNVLYTDQLEELKLANFYIR